MPHIKQIAQDPRKALNDLEKELGAERGALLREMNRLAGKDDDWTKHLPYLIAESYYEDEALRARYEEHVDSCEYCKVLLQTLHPPDPQVVDFAREAAAREAAVARPARVPSARRSLPAYWVPLAMAASVTITVFAVPQLQREGVLSSPLRERRLVVDELRQEPSRLVNLETSNNPTERYRAAQYYFAIEQPQLAYRQIGEGLELSGLTAYDAREITTAADVPSVNSAETIESAARRLANLQSTSSNKDSADYLEIARLQAKLGFHDEALKSIRQYLKARDTDPKIVAEFSETALSKRWKAVAIDN